jgi:hypothetical protein
VQVATTGEVDVGQAVIDGAAAAAGYGASRIGRPKAAVSSSEGVLTPDEILPAESGQKQLNPSRRERVTRRADERARDASNELGPFEVDGGTEARSLLHRALERQGLNKTPNGLKEPQKGAKWVEGPYEYMVRVHPADPTWGKTDLIYRAGRRRLGNVPGTTQGYGWEYVDSSGAWHRVETLNPKNQHLYNATAAADTHIEVNKP